MPRFVRNVLAFLLAGAAHAPALGGGLNPPGGAPAPTMKTLDQVEPRTPVNSTTCPGDVDSSFRITAPGSYYLTGNIVGASGFNGIKISASDVTLDLMGFAVRGVPGSRSGIAVDLISLTLANITIRNGAVEGWGAFGVGAVFDEGFPGSAKSMVSRSTPPTASNSRTSAR